MEATASLIYRIIQWQAAHISPQILAAVYQTKIIETIYTTAFFFISKAHMS